MLLMFALSPFLVLGGGALLLMLAEVFSRRPSGLAIGTTIVFITSGAFSVALWLYGIEFLPVGILSPWILVDKFTLFFNVLLCLGGALASLLAGGYLVEYKLNRGEFYSILLFATFGGMMLASAGDFLTLFLGLETMSLGAYALTAFRRASPRSAEGALKYFLLGSFAAAIMLYGIALVYGATGSTDLARVGAAFSHGVVTSHPMALIGLVLIVIGLLFKVSAVPFHMWTPDAYEGAPTPATAYMAVVVKSAAFAMMLRVLLTSFGDAESMSWSAGWPPALAAIAVLTMTVANLIAGRQDSVKRMLAYSSIAHAGYLLVGVVVALRSKEQAAAGVIFYLATYTVSTIGAFGALILLGSYGKEAVSYDDLAGVGKRHPAIAMAFSLFLFSLAGVPPTAGFFGKWFIFRAAMDSGFYWLTILAFINSVIGAYYYLRVLVFMYMREPQPGAAIAVPMQSRHVKAALLLSAVFVLALGLAPTCTLDAAIAAATTFRM